MAPLPLRLSTPLVCLLFHYLTSLAFALPAKFDRTQVYKGMGIVTDMAFLPDGMILLADFNGMIYIADPASNKNNAYELYMEIKDINTKGERGLVSIELDPDFATNSTSKC
jgi:glucose/arabinose dehydrogenase